MGQKRDCPDPVPGFGLAEAGFPLNTLHTTPGENKAWKMLRGNNRLNYCQGMYDYFLGFIPVSPPHTFSC